MSSEHTVFILGAGASADAGVPVMADFVHTAQDLLASGRLKADDPDMEHFQKTFVAINELRRTFAKSTLDLRNIESIFAAFEMAELVDQLGSLDKQQREGLHKSIVRVITRTIEETMLWTMHTPGERPFSWLWPHTIYLRLARLITSLARQQEITVITFNYDYGLEYALACAQPDDQRLVDYCLGDDAPASSSIRFLKLHGSLGWNAVSCGTENTIAPVKIETQSFQDVRVQTAPEDQFTCRLLSDRVTEPFIIPPTNNKLRGQQALAKVWRQAALSLRDAQNIIVMGYSLPESDRFFRDLFALGTIGNERLRKFWVFDKAVGTQQVLLRKRFARMFGPETLSQFGLFGSGRLRDLLIFREDWTLDLLKEKAKHAPPVQ